MHFFIKAATSSASLDGLDGCVENGTVRIRPGNDAMVCLKRRFGYRAAVLLNRLPADAVELSTARFARTAKAALLSDVKPR